MPVLDLPRGFGEVSSFEIDAAAPLYGFGREPFGFAARVAQVAAIWARAGAVFPDEAGTVVGAIGTWTSEGPWRVRVSGQPSDCYSARPGRGLDCYTERKRKVLFFTLPALSVGTYDVDFTQNGVTTTITGMLEVIPRNRAAETQSIRRTFPPYYATGDEDTDGSGVLEVLTKAFGQIIQQTNGAPQTRLTAALSGASATVESTLGFPDSGEAWIGTRLYEYGSKTSTTLDALVLLNASDGTALAVGTEVTLNARALLPD